MSKFILVTNYDDWEGLYKDGLLITEGHQIHRKTFVELLEGEGYIEQEADYDWLADRGNLPEKLEDVQFAEE